MADINPVDLRKSFEQLCEDISAYFDHITESVERKFADTVFTLTAGRPALYWNHVPDEMQAHADTLVRRLLAWGGQFAPLLKVAPLASESDQRELMLGIKSIRSAILLRKFRHQDADVLHNEDVVLGLRPAWQSDNEPLRPSAAKAEVADTARTILAAVQLVEASGNLSGGGISEVTDKGGGAARYRPGIAFLMMWMDKSKPELEDVSVAVKEVFAEFDIKAVRADDIEHEGLITQRIINEIATSEFLFADLSGARPNVYYEVGYAHALGKRVILFRKGETALHFDLAGYNCPAYVNVKDLKDKLRRRLTEMTNRQAKGA
jgi:hypothetical protein